jgi:hypothetical protein
VAASHGPEELERNLSSLWQLKLGHNLNALDRRLDQLRVDATQRHAHAQQSPYPWTAVSFPDATDKACRAD